MVKKMWADPNLNEFYGRVKRIEKAHAKGYGFEARGTLGRSSTWKRDRSAWRFLKPLTLVLAMGLCLKGVIHHYVGAELYQQRVDVLMTGEGFDRVGGTLMQADQVTLAISGAVASVFPK
jgi:hypothetical protein